MQTVDYSAVLTGAAGLAGFDPARLPLVEANRLREVLSRRLEMAWEETFWPPLMRMEERFFAPAWNATDTFTAGTHVWFWGTQQYYQALKTTLAGQAPATESGGAWTMNAAYWAVAATEFGADDFNAATTYAVGDLVRWTEDGETYQAHTTPAGAEPDDATKWGRRTAFERTVDLEQADETAIGAVQAIWDVNPRRVRNACRLDFKLAGEALTVLANVDRVWVEYRIRAVELRGDLFVAGAAYAVGDAIYFASGNPARGNFYTCLATTTAGQSPATHAVKWELIEIPKFLQRHLERAAAAEYLKGEADTTGANYMEAAAGAELARAVNVALGQQDQRMSFQVNNR